MTYLRMPLSIETGKEAEFSTATATEHKRRLIFLLECAAIMRERKVMLSYGRRTEFRQPQND